MIQAAFPNILDIIEADFEEAALKTFRTQAKNNSVYKQYLQLIKKDPASVNRMEEIPFLPISFFKTHKVLLDNANTALSFKSSTTTGHLPSQHHIVDPKSYEDSLTFGFGETYGLPSDHVFLALLPSYLEQGDSSLVYMVDHLMKLSNHPDNGFYLDDLENLSTILSRRNAATDKKTILLGVSYALLDLAEKHPQALENITIIETGGMKGRRKELTKKELHHTLCKAFHTNEIHSEYGMTELLSQAWSKGAGIFRPIKTMEVLVRDVNDPLSLVEIGIAGALNIIDLSNQYSCSFIATEDLGRKFEDGSFEILGRLDASDIRGCNLMVAD